jgi:glycosyltransferase involved in cell wall biosynthesis
VNIIIVPVLSNLPMTRTAIQSALTQDIGDVTVMAIDNGSRDGCGSYIRSLPRSITLSYSSPHGVSHVWNSALTLTFDQWNLEYALVINNDVWLRPDTYRLLVADGGLFVTGVSVSDRKQTTDINERSRSPHPSFSCYLIRSKVWRTVGQFDESMAIYASDGDYHLRMDKAGIDAYAIALPFFHEVSGTLKSASPEERDRICRQSDRDRETFAKKWGCGIGTTEYYSLFRQPRDNLYERTGRLA